MAQRALSYRRIGELKRGTLRRGQWTAALSSRFPRTPSSRVFALTAARPGSRSPMTDKGKELFSGSNIMEAGIFQPEKDAGKSQFQQELNRWFESRGIISDLRSHLRHLMVTALQSTHVGVKPADRSSPKAHAFNLMIGEFLFRHGCHYTLSVFTSEVPSLANFNLDDTLQGGKKRRRSNCFQENEVEEIFNALGMSPGTEELGVLKRRYLEKGNETSLIELFLQMAGEMTTKLQIRQNLESFAVEGERLLSKKWSSKVVDILVNEKMTPSQIEAVETAIFRITENETRRAVAEERRLQLRVLSERERRIQEYLRKHEEDIFLRLTEAEKDLTTRKELIDEELSEREKHLTEMALEWNSKHEEILRLSKKFHDIETENRNYKRRVKELEEENGNLKRQEEMQTTTINDMREEMNSLIGKLKDVTESNVILSERIQMLINREAKDNGKQQVTPRETFDVPLLWSKNMSPDRHAKEESSPKTKTDAFPVRNQFKAHLGSGDSEPNAPFNYQSPDSGEDVSLASSSGDIIEEVQKKLQALEEESDRLNRNYLECKLKYVSADSDSESSEGPTVKSPPNVRCFTPKETKYCQTNIEDVFAKIEKLTVKEDKREFPTEGTFPRKPDVEVMQQPAMRPPTKRQLQHRDFFLKNRQLLHSLETENVGGFETSPSISVSGSELTETSKREKSPVPSTPRRTEDSPDAKKKPSTESVRKPLVDAPNQLPKSDAECLALLEEARIKSPLQSVRKPLRQQILLSDPEEKMEEKEKNNFGESVVVGSSPRSSSSGRISVGKTGSDGF